MELKCRIYELLKRFGCPDEEIEEVFVKLSTQSRCNH